MTLSPYVDASRHFQETVGANPSVGQLVRRLEMYGVSSAYRFYESRKLARVRAYATIRTLSRLEELTLLDMTTDEANAVLAALPSPSLRSLKLQLHWTADPLHRQDLWTRFCHFELHALECSDWSSAPDIRPRMPRSTFRCQSSKSCTRPIVS